MEEDFLEQLQKFWSEERKQFYKEKMDLLLAKICDMDEQYNKENGHHFIRFTESRLKSPESIYGKIKRKNKEENVEKLEENINDLAGIRIVCYNIRQVYYLAGLVEHMADLRILKTKDYIKKPKENGYQSYHILVQMGEVKVELQLRTMLMDVWSSLNGVILYKKNCSLSSEEQIAIKKFVKSIHRLDKVVSQILE